MGERLLALVVQPMDSSPCWSSRQNNQEGAPSPHQGRRPHTKHGERRASAKPCYALDVGLNRYLELVKDVDARLDDRYIRFVRSGIRIDSVAIAAAAATVTWRADGRRRAGAGKI